MPQNALVDPTQVAPSKHSLFVRGFPGSVDIDDIREFFSKRANGECKIDFSSLSEDKLHLFVAVRFPSHGVAKKIFAKYEGERIFGHKIEMNWFKDIRKATKKATKNVSTKSSVKSATTKRRENIRRRESTYESSRSRSRSSEYSRNSYQSSSRSANRDHSRSSTSSGEIRSRHRSNKTVSQRSTERSRHRNHSSSSAASSSSSSSASSSSTRHSFREKPAPHSPNKSSIVDKQIVNAALEANPAHQRGDSAARSVSCASSNHTQQDQESNQSDVVEHRRVIVTKHVPVKVWKEKRKHRELVEQPPIKKAYMSIKTSMAEQPEPPQQQQHQQEPDDMVMEDEPTVQNAGYDEVHAMLECEDIPLHNIFLPDEQPMINTSQPETEKTSKSESLVSVPLPAAPPPAAQTTTIASTTVSIIESDADNYIPIPSTPQISTNVTNVTPSTLTNGEALHAIINGDEKTTTACETNISTCEIGIQSETNSAREEFDSSLLQLSFVTDSQLDVIFQKKRLIEAAYRLDCESYTTSVAKLVRMNPDLKDRLICSLRSLLEERAKRSIAELQEHIRAIQPS